MNNGIKNMQERERDQRKEEALKPIHVTVSQIPSHAGDSIVWKGMKCFDTAAEALEYCKCLSNDEVLGCITIDLNTLTKLAATELDVVK